MPSVAVSRSGKEKIPPSPSRIWLNQVDPNGRAVDPRFIEAGYQKENAFFRYRADRLRDKAVVANLIEKAVYRASSAEKREPLRDVGAYLFRVFSRLADQEIARRPRIVNCDPGSLEGLLRPQTANGQHLIDGIQVQEILEEIEPDLRWAIERRALGFGVQEIATDLAVSAGCLSARMRRGLQQAMKRLLGDSVR